MRKTFRRRQKPTLSLLLSAIILVTMPLAIYSLITTDSFDLRHFAYQDDTTISKCIINIPYVNPKTLEKDETYQAYLYTNVANENIKNVEIFNKDNEELFSKEYSPSLGEITEVFTFTPKTLGQEKFWGAIQTETTSYPCVMDKSQELIFIVENNHPPEFLTDPYFSAKPPSSSLTLDETYEYVLEVVDRDLDTIEYHYSFTPRALWLHKTVVESGKDGKLKIRFVGSPDKEGSYLANIFVHDGHNKHFSAQTWVINIGKESSDIPVRQEPRVSIIQSDIANEIILDEPQIAKILPEENSYTTNPKEIISANLISSSKGSIKENSIIFKLNNENLTDQADIIKISEKEILFRYTPTSNLDAGEHNIYIYFKDSNDLEIEKEWTFTVNLDGQEKTFFGLPINTIMLFVVGTLLVLFALSIPWIIYIAWKKDEPQEYEELIIIKPDGESSFQTSFSKKEINKKNKKEKE